MNVELNHTIVHVKDRWAAAGDVASVLGRGHWLEIITRPYGSGG